MYFREDCHFCFCPSEKMSNQKVCLDDHDRFDGNPMRGQAWDNLKSRKEFYVNLYSVQSSHFGLTSKEISSNLFSLHTSKAKDL